MNSTKIHANASEVLVVEDSDEDFQVTIRALKSAGLTHPIMRCTNGDDALNFLYRRGPYKGRHCTLPNLILLDLNLPGTDGREVLQQLKSDEALRVIPTIVLTTSNHRHDIEACYRAGANAFMTKPVDFDTFVASVATLVSYWFTVVKLPEMLH